ncbi:MAG: hypothetical protein GF332_03800 [Candidatus Moranbacteria bacterium]|nr:hypothetical protein [Candidatus Moranbacteria bacterium]
MKIRNSKFIFLFIFFTLIYLIGVHFFISSTIASRNSSPDSASLSQTKATDLERLDTEGKETDPKKPKQSFNSQNKIFDQNNKDNNQVKTSSPIPNPGQPKSSAPRSEPYQPPKPPENINILFAGDLMFDRYIRLVANRRGPAYIFGNLDRLFLKQDLVVVNLEGPITANHSLSINTPMNSSDNLIFTFDPSLVQTLQKHNIKLVNLGNNHILNFGQAGYEQTKKSLGQGGIFYFGSVNTKKDHKNHIHDFSGFRIGLINYNQFNKKIAFNYTLDQIKKLREKVDYLIVYTHWDREYYFTPLASTRSKAHQIVDAGADLIIGSHSHVIQETEIYQNKTIYYSLGNFIFDQYFRADTRKGLLVELNIDTQSKNVEQKKYFIRMSPDGQTNLIQS